MTPKEKANELVEKFSKIEHTYLIGRGKYMFIEESKKCALIAVDEIIKALESDRIIYGSIYRYEESEYWQEVKKEIEEK